MHACVSMQCAMCMVHRFAIRFKFPYHCKKYKKKSTTVDVGTSSNTWHAFNLIRCKHTDKYTHVHTTGTLKWFIKFTTDARRRQWQQRRNNNDVGDDVFYLITVIARSYNTLFVHYIHMKCIKSTHTSMDCCVNVRIHGQSNKLQIIFKRTPNFIYLHIWW